MRKILRIAAVVTALSVLIGLAGCSKKEKTFVIDVACIVSDPESSGTAALAMEKRKIPFLTGDELYRRIAFELTVSPSDDRLKPALRFMDTLQDVFLNDHILTCVFSTSLKSVDDPTLTLVLGALTRTYCALSDVTGVRIYAGPTLLHEGTLSTEDFVMDSSALRIQEHTLRLYYPDIHGESLETASCSVHLAADANLPLAVMETLLSGPVTESGYIIRFIPEGTRINNIRVENSMCCVDLSEEFLSSNIASADGTSLTIYAIVNSLTALSGISSVLFMIDGEVVESPYHPHFDQPINPRTPGVLEDF